jgi:hypothetical protein
MVLRLGCGLGGGEPDGNAIHHASDFARAGLNWKIIIFFNSMSVFSGSPAGFLNHGSTLT